MSETTEYMIGGFAHWEDSEGTWWYRDAIGIACVATLAMMPYLEAFAAARREVETVTQQRDSLAAELEAVRVALNDVVRLFRHYETVPCLSELLHDESAYGCECTGCMARKWMANFGRALAAQEGTDGH